jgi:hypothetical protein
MNAELESQGCLHPAYVRQALHVLHEPLRVCVMLDRACGQDRAIGTERGTFSVEKLTRVEREVPDRQRLISPASRKRIVQKCVRQDVLIGYLDYRFDIRYISLSAPRVAVKADEVDLLLSAIVQVFFVIFQVPRRGTGEKVVPGNHPSDSKRLDVPGNLTEDFVRENPDEGKEDDGKEGSFYVSSLVCDRACRSILQGKGRCKKGNAKG